MCWVAYQIAQTLYFYFGLCNAREAIMKSVTPYTH